MKSMDKNDHIPGDYVILEGRSHGNYEYPDLLVAKHRLRSDEWTDEVAYILGLGLMDTALEKCGHPYIGNINGEESLKLALLLNHFVLNLRQGIDFKLLLNSKKVFSDTGKKLSSLEIEAINDEIFGLRNPWRAEHLDARSNNGQIFYDHYLNKYFELVPERSEDLKECVRKDGIIDLSSCNEQGLPTKEGKDLDYLHPRNNAVARFSAGSGGAGLNFRLSPQDAHSGVGLRLARKK